MYRIFRPEKDAYITDRVVKGRRSHDANVGRAGTIDIYKLYGVTKSGSIDNVELTRGLLKFDIQDLKDDYNSGKVDISSSRFRCNLRLFDVYGGQSTPDNFTLVVHPLSRSFDEGVGRDVVFYQDKDTCNFLTASSNGGPWFVSGANSKGTLGDPAIDVVQSASFGAGLVSTWRTQGFPKGTEDLDIDITTIVSGILAGQLPDHGFRLSFVDNEESDQETRFVKRFASKEASDPTKHPQLLVRYDDSVQSTARNFVFDYPGTLFFYNKVRGTLRNLISASSEVTGANSIVLQLRTQISGGYYSSSFIGSQHVYAGNNVVGVYSASFTLSSLNTVYRSKLLESSSVVFDTIWSSPDGTVAYLTSSEELYVSLPDRGGSAPLPKKYTVVATNVAGEYKRSDEARIRIHIDDFDLPYVKMVKQPFILPSFVPEKAHYSIRDSVSGDVVVDFDDVYDSTRLSSDDTSLWFDFHMSNLYEGRLYEIDVMLTENGLKRHYRGISAPFKISSIT